MSRKGKVFIILSVLGLVSLVLVRTVLGGWIDLLYIPLALFVLGGMASFAVDFAFYKEFMTMRTTKHGMNMSTMIGLALILIFAINFVAIQRNVKWDLTEEGLNSVSDQTLKVLKKIDEPLKVMFFFRAGTEGVDQVRDRLQKIVGLYQDENSKIQIQFIDSIKRPGLAKDYGVDRAAATVFVTYKGKRNRLDNLNEEGLTTAILKATRDKNKKVYFTTGHGERSSADQDVEGISDFKEALAGSGYDSAELSLLDNKTIPEDADMVAIIGAKTAFLEGELAALREYAKKGGRLFIAVDPGERHNLALLTKSFGIEFTNTFILDQSSALVGASAAMSLGRQYGSTPITKGFRSEMVTLFLLGGALKKAPDTSFTVEDIVSAGETSFTVDEVVAGRVKVDPDRRGPHAVLMASKGKLDGADKEFNVIVAGDSDFVSNQLLYQQLNRDLALNSMSYLLAESNLISIRPKRPTGTTLTMTKTDFWLYFFGFILPLPLLLFGGGSFFWYRRRSA